MYAECKSRGGDTNRPHKRPFCATGPRRPITSTQPTREREGEQNVSRLVTAASQCVRRPSVVCSSLIDSPRNSDCDLVILVF